MHTPPGAPATPARLAEELAEVGVGVDDVDTVLFTHLHADHVGWNLVYAMRLPRALSTRWTHPLVLTVLLSGGALIWVKSWDFMATGWLLASVVIFTASFLYASLVQNRDLARVLTLMEQGPPASLPAGLQAELAARRRRIRYGGLFMRGVVLGVLFLMIAKPF